jgi:hypothetical protein
MFHWPSKKSLLENTELLSSIMAGADQEERYEKLLAACVKVHTQGETSGVFPRIGILGRSDDVYAKFLNLEIQKIQVEKENAHVVSKDSDTTMTSSASIV